MPPSTSSSRTRILLVEDNPLDARATLRALEGLAHPHDAEHLVNGSEALTALSRHAQSDSIPDLVLLDLNASGMRGLEVLQAIGSDQLLRDIPVVILSTSDSQADIDTALQNGARTYFIKPRSLDGWTDIIAGLDAIVGGTAPPTPTADS